MRHGAYTFIAATKSTRERESGEMHKHASEFLEKAIKDDHSSAPMFALNAYRVRLFEK